MQKPNEYDGAEAKQGGTDFPKPQAGGYVAKIIKAEEKKSSKGNQMLVLALDISEGEFVGHFAKLTEHFKKDCYIQIFQLTEGDHVSYFKGLIKAIEHSNTGFIFDFDEQKLVGKRIGINLREEEYQNDANEIKTSLKVGFYCSVDDVRKGLPVLAKKLLSGKKPQAVVANNGVPEDSGLPF